MTSTQLVSTGMRLAGAGTLGPSQMVADGSGYVWIRGPWSLTRLDPQSGAARTWDASDDAWFAYSDLALAPSKNSGVWLLQGASIRLFDGERFAADLRVPDALLAEGRAVGLDTRVTDVEELGSGIAVSLEDVSPGPYHEPAEGGRGRVVRWSDGVWTGMSGRGDGVSGLLSAGGDGTVWATGLVGLADVARVRRWDGSGWVPSGPDDPDGVIFPVEVAADQSGGGAWLLCEQCTQAGGEYERIGVQRFDGRQWQAVSAAAEEVGAYEPLSLETRHHHGWFVVSQQGDAWLAGPYGAARISPNGNVERFAADQGLDYDPDSGWNTIKGIASTSNGVVVLDGLGVLRLEGDRFIRVWENPDEGVPGDGSRQDLLAVSVDEAWAVQFNDVPPDGWEARLTRFRDGSWEEVGPALGEGSYCGTVLGTDGAVWATSSDGLIRVDGDDYRVVAPDVVACPEAAGPDGSVWLIEGTRFGWHPEDSDDREDLLVRYRADGTRVSVGRPEGWQVMCFMAAGRDGSAWVSGGHGDSESGGYLCPDEGEESYKGPGDELAQWDGRRWTKVAAPAPPGFAGMAVSDGTVWAATTGLGEYPGSGSEETWIDWYRFERGGWAKAVHDSGGLLAPGWLSVLSVLPIPGGGACAQRPVFGTLVCVEPDGQVHRIEALGPLVESGVQEFAIGGDGSVWVLAPQIGRLPGAETARG